QEKTNWMYVIPIGIVWLFIYYFIFSFLINKLNLKTPGREDKKAEEETQTSSENTKQSKRSLAIIEALGGKDNITNIDNCATRLRVSVKDGEMVDKESLMQTGTHGVVIKGNGVR